MVLVAEWCWVGDGRIGAWGHLGVEDLVWRRRWPRGYGGWADLRRLGDRRCRVGVVQLCGFVAAAALVFVVKVALGCEGGELVVRGEVLVWWGRWSAGWRGGSG